MRNTCLNEIHKLAKVNKKILFIGSDLGAGTLADMQQEIPDQFIMEGISEQHIIGMSAGLAMEGFTPYVNSIAPFLTRRCYEQVLVDLCLHNLPVRLIGNGGGVVYAPLGPTHLAVEDIAIFRVIPNMTIIAPCDAEEMVRLVKQTVNWPHPIYIRLAKGGDKVVSNKKNGFEIVEHIKTANYIETVFQTLTAYLYHSVVPKGLRTILTLTLIAPLNILGIFLGKVLPIDKSYYLNNIMLCVKIK